MLTDVEQHKLETDLVAARDQQQIAVGVPPASRKKKEPAKTERQPGPNAGKIRASSRAGSRFRPGIKRAHLLAFVRSC